MYRISFFLTFKDIEHGISHLLIQIHVKFKSIIISISLSLYEFSYHIFKLSWDYASFYKDTLSQNISNRSKLCKLKRVNAMSWGMEGGIVYLNKQHDICSKYGTVISFFYIISNKWVIILLLSLYILLHRIFLKQVEISISFPASVHLRNFLTGFALS